MKKSMEIIKQKMFQKNNKGQKGITLIALVITIIVLLILAGVTIAMLSGNNSAPQKATEAAQKDAIAGAKDEIAMEVQETLLNYYNNTYVKGNVTEGASTQSVVAKAAKKAVDSAKSKNKQLLDSSTVDGNTIILKTKSYTVTGTIDEKCGISWSDIVTSTGETGETLTKSQKINKAIGQTVNYTDQENNENSQGWRVFYASESEMFLISTDCIDSSKAYGGAYGIPLAPKGKYSEPESGDYYNYTNADDKYKGSEDVFSAKTADFSSGYSYSNVTYGADYNEKWKTKLGKTTSTNNNSKAIAYLCDPQNWEKYISKDAPTGTYAVGGPTKELLVLSWNEAVKNNKEDGPKTTVIWDDEADIETEGYLWNKPKALSNDITPYPINEDILEGLYSTGYCWLASPSSLSIGTVCLLNRNYVDYDGYDTDCPVRPIVSIPISNVQILEDVTVQIVK